MRLKLLISGRRREFKTLPLTDTRRRRRLTFHSKYTHRRGIIILLCRSFTVSRESTPGRSCRLRNARQRRLPAFRLGGQQVLNIFWNPRTTNHRTTRVLDHTTRRSLFMVITRRRDCRRLYRRQRRTGRRYRRRSAFVRRVCVRGFVRHSDSLLLCRRRPDAALASVDSSGHRGLLPATTVVHGFTFYKHAHVARRIKR